MTDQEPTHRCPRCQSGDVWYDAQTWMLCNPNTYETKEDPLGGDVEYESEYHIKCEACGEDEDDGGLWMIEDDGFTEAEHYEARAWSRIEAPDWWKLEPATQAALIRRWRERNPQ